MELPTQVLIHNETIGMKGSRGRLLTISPHGYYEINAEFGDRTHRILLPVEGTVIISQEAEEVGAGEAIEVER